MAVFSSNVPGMSILAAARRGELAALLLQAVLAQLKHTALSSLTDHSKRGQTVHSAVSITLTHSGRRLAALAELLKTFLPRSRVILAVVVSVVTISRGYAIHEGVATEDHPVGQTMPPIERTLPRALSPHRASPPSATPKETENGEWRARKFRLALDTGHTPRSAGALGADGKMEYEFNKRIVQLIVADLARDPKVSVIVINPEGKEISLGRRSIIANEAKADLFLAIHHDSVNDRYLTARVINGRKLYQCNRFHGYSVFFSTKNANPDASLAFAKALGTAMRDEGLAATAHHAENIPGENRQLVFPELGVYRYDNLVVLKKSQMPAALLECGVIVNPVEETELNQLERQQKTVRAVQKAVIAVMKTARGITPTRDSASQQN